MLDIEELEISLGQGPCLEAYRTGEQVLVADLAQCHERRPDVTPRIVALGVGDAVGVRVPLLLRGDRIGALNLFRVKVKTFAPHEVRLGQALADVAAVGILQERAVFAAERRADQLQRALNSRIMIEQAKGALAERRHIPPGEAFQRLRSHARSNNMKLRGLPPGHERRTRPLTHAGVAAGER